MKWVSHVVVGTSVAAVWRPELVPLAIMGSTAPDWLEWLLERVGRRVRHRAQTHYAAYWVMALAFGLWVWDWHYAIAAFAAGGLSHVFCDSLTIQGVPLGWWSDRRFHLFGGRMRTGRPGEYWFAGAVFAACLGLSLLTRHWGGGGYAPFFYDWAGYYHRGVIDASEWKANRFRWL